jgi:hypothetical protein
VAYVPFVVESDEDDELVNEPRGARGAGGDDD